MRCYGVASDGSRGQIPISSHCQRLQSSFPQEHCNAGHSPTPTWGMERCQATSLSVVRALRGKSDISNYNKSICVYIEEEKES